MLVTYELTDWYGPDLPSSIHFYLFHKEGEFASSICFLRQSVSDWITFLRKQDSSLSRQVTCLFRVYVCVGPTRQFLEIVKMGWLKLSPFPNFTELCKYIFPNRSEFEFHLSSAVFYMQLLFVSSTQSPYP